MKLYRLSPVSLYGCHYTTAARSTEEAVDQICKHLEKQIRKEVKYEEGMKEFYQDELTRVREWHKHGFNLQTKELNEVFEGEWSG